MLDRQLILGEDLSTQVTYFADQLRDDNLPTITPTAPQSTDSYKDAGFVKQLTLIELAESGVLQAVRDYFKAFTLRSQWQRLDLVSVGELGDYERRLAEEWSIRFRWMVDDLGPDATEEAMLRESHLLYRWVERECNEWIRPSCLDRAVVRGSYHLLADDLRVGWHAQFKERLAELLKQEVTV